MPLETIVTRAGSAADAEAIRSLALAELGRAPTSTRLRDVLGRYPSVVAYEGGRLRAFVFGVAFSPDIIEMANLLVETPCRNAGLGTRLIGLFEDAARPGYRAIILANSQLWSISDGRKVSAASLYGRLGYREIYATPDTVVMIKELTDEQ